MIRWLRGLLRDLLVFDETGEFPSSSCANEDAPPVRATVREGQSDLPAGVLPTDPVGPH